MFKKTSLMLALVLALSLCVFGVALADQCGEPKTEVGTTIEYKHTEVDPPYVCTKTPIINKVCSVDMVSTKSATVTGCDNAPEGAVLPGSIMVSNLWVHEHANVTCKVIWDPALNDGAGDYVVDDESIVVTNNDHIFTQVGATEWDTTNWHSIKKGCYCHQEYTVRDYTILKDCARTGKENCKHVVVYGCNLVEGHDGTCVFTRVAREFDTHTKMYEDGCIEYKCPNCKGTIANTNGHKNICPVCKNCSEKAHKYCTICDQCYGTDSPAMYHCAVCGYCDERIHQHCTKCGVEYSGTVTLAQHAFYCKTCKACFPVEHIHCDKCKSTHPKDYTYCADCKACFAVAHTYCKECGLCSVKGHKATCSKYACPKCEAMGKKGTNPGVISSTTHFAGCPYYQCPICKKIGDPANHAVAECTSQPCFRCGGTVSKHLNVCAHCGVCNGEHLDPKKVCACGMCEYDGVTAASKHYNYCKVCNTCGGNHLSYCTAKKAKLENPKPAWEKGGVVIGSSSQNPSAPGASTTKKASSSSSKSDTPKTGDNSVSYAVLLSLLALSATCFVVTRKVNAK